MGKATNKHEISDVCKEEPEACEAIKRKRKRTNAKAIKHKSTQVATMMFKSLNLQGEHPSNPHIYGHAHKQMNTGFNFYSL
jgi:hypothetical protein